MMADTNYTPEAKRSDDNHDITTSDAEMASFPPDHTQDSADMSRMGKTQVLKRNYRPLSALAFTVILQGVWEVLLT